MTVYSCYNINVNRNLFASWTFNDIKPNLPAGSFMFNSLQYISFLYSVFFFAVIEYKLCTVPLYQAKKI